MAIGSGGVGMVIRNDRREFMAAMLQTVDGVQDSVLIESLAALRALEVASSIGYDRVVLEGDALGIINAIAREDEDFSAIGNIILEIKLRAREFQSFSVNHVKHATNEIAHKTAKYAFVLRDLNVWMEDPPLFLTDVLLQDNLS